MTVEEGDTLYVVFGDVYEQRDIEDIYPTLEAAQLAHPGEWTEYHPGRWSRDNKGRPEYDYQEIVRYEIPG